MVPGDMTLRTAAEPIPEGTGLKELRVRLRQNQTEMFGYGKAEDLSLKPLIKDYRDTSAFRNPERSGHIGSNTKREYGNEATAEFLSHRQTTLATTTPAHHRFTIDDSEMAKKGSYCKSRIGAHLMDNMQAPSLPACTEHDIGRAIPIKYDYGGNTSIDKKHLDSLRPLWNGTRRFVFQA